MRHLKIFEANWLGDDMFRKSELLISQICSSAKSYGFLISPDRFKFYDDFNDRNRDESEMRYPPIGIESQYRDFFIIMPHEIGPSMLGLLEPLLKTPFMGKMYCDRNYNRMVVRINGNGQWLSWSKIKKGSEKDKKV
jgi:hypothetical protein